MPSLSPPPSPESHACDFIIHFSDISFNDMSKTCMMREDWGFSAVTFHVVFLDVKVLYILVRETNFADAPRHKYLSNT